MTQKKSERKESKLRRYMKAPFRFLMKARDIYVRGMIECSGHFAYVDAAMGCPTGNLSTLPRSFSVTSARSSPCDDDFKELVRAASLRSHRNNRVDVFGDVATKVPRSRSVTIGRIDENEPCEFGDDIANKPFVYPRSRSYAVRRGGTGYFN